MYKNLSRVRGHSNAHPQNVALGYDFKKFSASSFVGCNEIFLVRPTYSMSADLYFTSVSFFFRPLISEVAERNSTKIGHMVGSKCNLKTHVRNLAYPSLTNRVHKNHLFGQLRNLTATLTACIFGMKHDIDNQSSALTTTRCLLHCPKMS